MKKATLLLGVLLLAYTSATAQWKKVKGDKTTIEVEENISVAEGVILLGSEPETQNYSWLTFRGPQGVGTHLDLQVREQLVTLTANRQLTFNVGEAAFNMSSEGPNSYLSLRTSEGISWLGIGNGSAFNLGPGVMPNSTALRLYSRASGGFYPGHIQMGVAGSQGRMDFLLGDIADMGSETVNAKMSLTQAGNLGIGTSAPQQTLHLFSEGRGGKLLSESTQPGVILKETDGEANENWWIDGHEGALRIMTTSDALDAWQTAIKVVQQAGAPDYTYFNGNVGVGTESPQSRLHVQGEFTQSGKQIYFDNADKINLVRNGYFDAGWKRSNDDEAEMLQMRDGNFNFYSAQQGASESSLEWQLLMTMKADGAVGIGLNPEEGRKLDVDGVINATGYTINGQNLYLQGDDIFIGDIETPAAELDIRAVQGTEIKFTDPVESGDIVADQDLSLLAGGRVLVGSVGAPEQMVLKEGRLGIGTTDPGSRLHVVGDGANSKALRVDDGGIAIRGGNTTINSLRFDDNTGEDRHVLYVDENNDVLFGNANLGNVRILGAGTNLLVPEGRVGIGTSDPQFALDVNGVINATAINVEGSLLGNWGASGADINFTSGNVGIGLASPEERLHVRGKMLAESSQPALLLKETDGNADENWRVDVKDGGFRLLPMTDAGALGAKAFSVEQSGDAYFSGNVGVGTTAPQQKLHVQGGNALFEGTQGAVPLAVWDTDGDARIQLGANTAGEAQYRYFGADAQGNFNIYHGDGSTVQMIVDKNGNVGIGKGYPESKLDVLGDISLSEQRPTLNFNADDDGTIRRKGGRDLYFVEGDSEPQMVMASGGNVGIGTTDPRHKLDVAGTINATNFELNGLPLLSDQTGGDGITFADNTFSLGGHIENDVAITRSTNTFEISTLRDGSTRFTPKIVMQEIGADAPLVMSVRDNEAPSLRIAYNKLTDGGVESGVTGDGLQARMAAVDLGLRNVASVIVRSGTEADAGGDVIVGDPFGGWNFRGMYYNVNTVMRNAGPGQNLRWIPDKEYSDSYLAGQRLNTVALTPSVNEDGHVLAWDATEEEYRLLAISSSSIQSEPTGGSSRYSVNTTDTGVSIDKDDGALSQLVVVNEMGHMGIGTSDPTAKLTVNGNILAEEVRVVTDVNAVPDYVFRDDYELQSLEEVEAYVKEHSHLPEVPSAEEIARDGQDVGEMNLLLLKKIEELTLHVIELKKENQRQSEVIMAKGLENEDLQERLHQVESQVESIIFQLMQSDDQ